MKRCYGCKLDLPLEAFAKDRHQRDGLNGTCRKCKYEYKKIYLKNPAKRAAENQHKSDYRKRMLISAGPELAIAREAKIKAVADRRVFVRLMQAAMSEVRKEVRHIKSGRWVRLCKCGAVFTPMRGCPICSGTKRRKYYRSRDSKARYRERYRRDSKFNLTVKMRRSINARVRGKHFWRLSRLPYTIEELETRLRRTIPEGYTWDDFLSGALHIDHIIPVAAFDYETPNDPDFARCWAIDNLRLLPARENLSKGSRMTREPMLSFCGSSAN